MCVCVLNNIDWYHIHKDLSINICIHFNSCYWVLYVTGNVPANLTKNEFTVNLASHNKSLTWTTDWPIWDGNEFYIVYRLRNDSMIYTTHVCVLHSMCELSIDISKNTSIWNLIFRSGNQFPAHSASLFETWFDYHLPRPLILSLLSYIYIYMTCFLHSLLSTFLWLLVAHCIKYVERLYDSSSFVA